MTTDPNLDLDRRLEAILMVVDEPQSVIALATALGAAGVRCDVVGTNKQHITLDSEIGRPGDFTTAVLASFLQSV